MELVTEIWGRGTQRRKDVGTIERGSEWQIWLLQIYTEPAKHVLLVT
jgi:hypothetical protein